MMSQQAQEEEDQDGCCYLLKKMMNVQLFPFSTQILRLQREKAAISGHESLCIIYIYTHTQTTPEKKEREAGRANSQTTELVIRRL